MQQYAEILKALRARNVRFVLIGGMAAVSHGSVTPTRDLDLCFDTEIENVERLYDALVPFQPVLRPVLAEGPVKLQEGTLRSGLAVNLQTSFGDLDLLPKVLNAGAYHDLAPKAITMEIFGMPVRIMDIDSLIASKKAVGRPKDLAVVHELAEIKRRLRERPPA